MARTEQELTDDEQVVLARLDDVWRPSRELGVLTTGRRTAALRGLRRKGLAVYRGHNGISGVLQVGEWATR